MNQSPAPQLLNLTFNPTVEELEAQLACLTDMVLTTRMYLRVARKAASRRQEGAQLPLNFTEPISSETPEGLDGPDEAE